jgi:hypothetical protein
MSLKRRNTSSPEADDSPVSKRQRPSLGDDSDESYDHPFSSEQPRSDPIYGQKGAFPGLDDNDDELFYGPPADGLEYLRMVRLVLLTALSFALSKLRHLPPRYCKLEP